MRISDITTQNLCDYLRLDDPTEIEVAEVERMKSSAVSFITGYTGLTTEQLDEHEDIAQALFVIVADMFDNRNLYIEGKASNINQSVEYILKMHSVNLL